MNTRLYELMLLAGYASPELAHKAHRLAEMIIQDCVDHAVSVGGINSGPQDPAVTASEIIKRITQTYDQSFC